MRRQVLRLGLFLALGSMLGCSMMPTPPSAATPLALTQITSVPALSTSAGFSADSQQVVEDSAAWSALWAAIWNGDSQPPALPAVDLTSTTVLFATMGKEPSGGYAVSIDSAAEADGVVAVQVTESSPGPSCVVAAVVTNPVAVAAIPKRASTAIQFQVMRTVRSCGA